MLDRKKIADIRIALIRSRVGGRQGGLLDSSVLRELLVSGSVLGELLALADAALGVRQAYLRLPPGGEDALGAMAALGRAAHGQMVKLDCLEEAARRAEGEGST
jgi:hypothetical protein